MRVILTESPATEGLAEVCRLLRQNFWAKSSSDIFCKQRISFFRSQSLNRLTKATQNQSVKQRSCKDALLKTRLTEVAFLSKADGRRSTRLSSDWKIAVISDWKSSEKISKVADDEKWNAVEVLSCFVTSGFAPVSLPRQGNAENHDICHLGHCNSGERFLVCGIALRNNHSSQRNNEIKQKPHSQLSCVRFNK